MSMDERGTLHASTPAAQPVERIEYRAQGGQFEIQRVPASHRQVALYRVRFRRVDGTTDTIGHMYTLPELGHCEQMLRRHAGERPQLEVKPARIALVLRAEETPRKARGTTKAARELDRFSRQYRPV